MASLLTVLINGGAPGWLQVLVVLCTWNATKFALMGPVSIVLLVRARTGEWRERRTLRRSITERPDASTGRSAEAPSVLLLVTIRPRRCLRMSALTDLASDERHARMLLSLLPSTTTSSPGASLGRQAPMRPCGSSTAPVRCRANSRGLPGLEEPPVPACAAR